MGRGCCIGAAEPGTEGGSKAGRRTGHSPTVPREGEEQRAVTVDGDKQHDLHAHGDEVTPN